MVRGGWPADLHWSHDRDRPGGESRRNEGTRAARRCERRRRPAMGERERVTRFFLRGRYLYLLSILGKLIGHCLFFSSLMFMVEVKASGYCGSQVISPRHGSKFAADILLASMHAYTSSMSE